tara:strand:+ start:15884 stop:16591 length:708 start_codon:yes stop_codon:yes gene_type:complete
MTGATGNIYCGLHEFADMALVLHFLAGRHESDASDLFVDVGANVGSYTVLAAGVVGVSTLAIEPVPTTFNSLMRNITTNRLQTIVETFNGAVGSEAGSIRFSTDRGPMNQVVDSNYPGDSQLVPVATLDNLLTKQEPTILKIDVEGFESAVLSGAQNVLASPATQAILLESDDPRISQSMDEAGFGCFDYDPITRTVLPVRQCRQLGNNLWIRAPESFQSRCRAAPPFSVFGFQF